MIEFKKRARSRWGAPSCRAGFGVSASFIVGFVRVVIVGQEWLRQVQQSSRTRGTDSIGDAICLMVLQLLSALSSNLESVIELAIVRNEINSRSCDEKRIYIKF